jgi:hypothetical protein
VLCCCELVHHEQAKESTENDPPPSGKTQEPHTEIEMPSHRLWYPDSTLIDSGRLGAQNDGEV